MHDINLYDPYVPANKWHPGKNGEKTPAICFVALIMHNQEENDNSPAFYFDVEYLKNPTWDNETITCFRKTPFKKDDRKITLVESSLHNKFTRYLENLEYGDLLSGTVNGGTVYGYCYEEEVSDFQDYLKRCAIRDLNNICHTSQSMIDELGASLFPF